MKKVYISGPISGRDTAEARAEFAEAAELIRAMGMEPVSPFDNGLPEGARWEDHMRKDLSMLLGCDGIWMLPGHEGSRGAAIERRLSRELGITRVDGMPPGKALAWAGTIQRLKGMTGDVL